MATTTQVTSYRAAGQPDDGVGAVGDVCTDTVNKGQWVKQANNSWVGGFQSAMGPVGPAQLSYNGMPPATFGQNGNGCCDLSTGNLLLKANNTWAATGGFVPTPSLTTQAASYASSVWANGLSSTATAQNLPLQGTTLIVPYTAPTGGSALVGYQLTSVSNSTATFTIALVDITTGSTIFSTSIAKGTVASAAFTTTQYPMTAGDQFQWQISGAGTAYVALTPQYLVPSSIGVANSFYGTWSTYSGQALSATSTALFVPGTSSSIQQTQYYRNSKLSYMQSAQFIVGAGTGTVNLVLTSGTVVYTAATITANSSTQTIVNVGPFGPSTALLSAGTNYYWAVTGSGTVSVAVNMSVVQ